MDPNKNYIKQTFSPHVEPKASHKGFWTGLLVTLSIITAVASLVIVIMTREQTNHLLQQQLSDSKTTTSGQGISSNLTTQQSANGVTGAATTTSSSVCSNGANATSTSSGSCVSLQSTSPGVTETGNINVSGIIKAANFLGSGIGLSGVNAASLNNQPSTFYTNASNITTGTLSASRLPSTINAATLNGQAGSYYLDAGNFNAGTLPIGRGGTGVTTTPSNGVLLIGNGTGYTPTTITAGSGVLVTNGSGSITISASGSGTCGTCVSLQPTSPGSADSGNINVSGAIIGGSFSGNGANVTNVNAASLGGQAGSYYTNASNISTGTLAAGRLPASATTQGNTFNGASQLVQLTAGGALPTVSGANLTSVNAATLNGQAASFYLDAGNLTGTLSNSRLNTSVTTQGNTFNGASQLVQLNGSGALPALSGANLTNINASTLNGQAPSFYQDAGNLTGTLSNSRLTSSVTLLGNSFNGASQLVQLTAGGILPVLSGANLTNINAASLNGQAASFYLDAGNLTGSLADARLSANVTLQGNTFNGASQLVQLTGGGVLPVLSAANLTNLTAGNIVGTLSDSNLSGNVAFLNASNTFTGANLFKPSSNSTTAFRIQNSNASTTVFNVDTTNGRVGIGNSAPTSTLDVTGTASVSSLSSCDRITSSSTGLLGCSKGDDLHISKLVVYGDSYTAGGTAGTPTYFNTYRFTSRVAALLHAQEFNHGINGTTSFVGNSTGGWVKVVQEQTNTHTAAPYTSNPGAYVLNYGGNDIKFLGGGSYGPLQEAFRTIISRFRAGAVFEDTSGTLSYGGTWGTTSSTTANSGSGYHNTTVNGSSVTVNVPSDFPGGTVDLTWLTDGTGDGATYNVTIDGVAQTAVNTRNLQYSVGGKLGITRRYTGLSSGAHTIIATITSITGTSYFDYWTIEAANPPLVVVPLTPRLISYATFSPVTPTDSDIVAMNAAKTSVINEFDSAVVSVDFDAALNKTATNFDSDNVHPNDMGHAKLAVATYNAITAAQLSVDQMTYNAQPSGNYTNRMTFQNNNDDTSGFQVQNAAGSSVLNVDTTNGYVSVGTTTPGYKLDVRGTTPTAQIHIASSDVDSGGYIASFTAGGIDIAGGAVFDGVNWVAKNTSAGNLAIQNGGSATLFLDTGLTAGNTFTPTGRLTVTTAGATFANALAINGNTTIGDANTDTLTINANSISLPNASTLSLSNSTTALNIGGGLLNLDAFNYRVGIGNNAPASLFNIDAPDATGLTAEKITFAMTNTIQGLADGTTIANYRPTFFGAQTLNGVAGGGTETATNAATVYIAGAVTGTNITITNSYALQVASGNSLFSGRVTVDATVGSSTNGLCWSGSTSVARIEDCNGAPTDLAENFGTPDASVGAGDIVSATGQVQTVVVNGTSTTKAFVQKAATDDNKRLIGIVSTAPNQVYGDDGVFDPSENPRPVSLAGRVPVKIAADSPAIEPGDFITVSTTPGKGTKATGEGMTVGRALESWTPGSGQATVIVQVGTQYYSPSVADVLQQNKAASFSGLNVTGNTSLVNLTVTGNLVAQTIKVNGHIIGNPDTRGNVTVASGATSAHYNFTVPYDSKPSVVLTPTNTFAPAYRVDADTQGFTIYLASPASSDIHFDFQAQQ